MAFKSSWHGAIIDDFADAFTESRSPIASGRESLKVHRLIDTLVESSERKKAVSSIDNTCQ